MAQTGRHAQVGRRPLFLRGLASRPVAALSLASLAACTMAAALLAPLLVRALAQSSLRDAVEATARDERSVTVTSILEDPSTLDAAVNDIRASLDSVTGPTSATATLWRPVVVGVQSGSNVRWQREKGPVSLSARVSVAPVDCAGIALASGRCPRTDGEVLLSRTDLTVDGTARPAPAKVVVELPDQRLQTWAVVGTYDIGATEPQLVTRKGTPQGTYASVTGDSLLVTQTQFQAVPVRVTVVGTLALKGAVTVDQAAQVSAAIGQVRAAAIAKQRQLVVDSGLSPVIADTDRTSREAGVLVTVTAVQAAVLSLLALVGITTRLARTRAPEWGLARLRGLPRRRWLLGIYAETGTALLLGSAGGVVGGLVVARLVCDHYLSTEVRLEPWRSSVLIGGGAAALAAVVALVAASAPLATRPLRELLREQSESRGTGRLATVASSAVVVLGAAAVYQVLAGGQLGREGQDLGLLAPGLVALTAALAVVQVVVVSMRWVTSRPPRGLVGLVVGRHAARAPSTVLPAVVVATAVSLAVFATQVPRMSEHNQVLRADAIVGADTVLHVTVPPGKDLIGLVDAADPGGRHAMAVMERAASADGSASRIVAADTTRMAAVAAWQPRWAGAAGLRGLTPSPEPDLRLTGRSITVQLGHVEVLPQPGYLTDVIARPDLDVTVDNGLRWTTVGLGPVQTRGGRMTAEVPCRTGCRLVGFGLTGQDRAPYTATVTIADVTAAPGRDGVGTPDGTVHEALRGPHLWPPHVGDRVQPDPDASATAVTSANGLVIHAFDYRGGAGEQVLAPGAQDPLPAVLGPTTAGDPFPGIPAAVSGSGLDAQPQLLTVAGRADVLPRALGEGVLVDLRQAARLVDPSQVRARAEVWLAPGAPSSITAALTKQGVTVDRTDRLETTRNQLLREPATRAARLGIPLAVLALLLSLVTLVSARATDGASRRADWASLRAAGVADRSLRRLARIEAATPGVVGVLLGVVTGVVTLSLVADRLPVVDLARPGPPIDTDLTVLPALAVGAGMVLALLVVAEIGARLETRPPRGRR